MRALQRLIREPAVCFLLTGAALFGVHRARSDETEPQEIIVGARFVDRLTNEHAARTGRVPDAGELRAAIDQHVSDEILVREAEALGLERGDPIVRRRLIQKMLLVLEDLGAQIEPTDAELRQYLEREAGRYRQPASVDLEHVFFDSSTPSARERAAAALGALVRGADGADLGEPFPMGRVLRGRSHEDLRNDLGARFAQDVQEAPVGRWVGPVTSQYGLHLVRVAERRPEGVPSLDRIRFRVRLDLLRQRRESARRTAMAELRSRYRVAIEASPSVIVPADGSPRLAYRSAP